jgi:hypothetical protein|nr:hypothetical protein [Kofleriaceae bacterium]
MTAPMQNLERRYRGRHKASAAVGLATIAAIALAKFGPSWFGSSIEHDIAAWAGDNVAPVDSVECANREPDRATFACTVTFDGGRAATVRVLEDKREAVFFWDPLIVDGATLAARLRPLLGGTWKDAAVDCGTGIVDVPDVGLRCTATKFGHSEHVVFLPGDRPIREEP